MNFIKKQRNQLNDKRCCVVSIVYTEVLIDLYNTLICIGISIFSRQHIKFFLENQLQKLKNDFFIIERGSSNCLIKTSQ